MPRPRLASSTARSAARCRLRTHRTSGRSSRVHLASYVARRAWAGASRAARARRDARSGFPSPVMAAPAVPHAVRPTSTASAVRCSLNRAVGTPAPAGIAAILGEATPDDRSSVRSDLLSNQSTSYSAHRPLPGSYGTLLRADRSRPCVAQGESHPRKTRTCSGCDRGFSLMASAAHAPKGRVHGAGDRGRTSRRSRSLVGTIGVERLDRVERSVGRVEPLRCTSRG